MNYEQRYTAVVALLRAHDDYQARERSLTHAITFAVERGISVAEIEHLLGLSTRRKNAA